LLNVALKSPEVMKRASETEKEFYLRRALEERRRAATLRGEERERHFRAIEELEEAAAAIQEPETRH